MGPLAESFLFEFLPSEKLTIAIKELTRFASRSAFSSLAGTPVISGPNVAITTTMHMVTVIIRTILSLITDLTIPGGDGGSRTLVRE